MFYLLFFLITVFAICNHSSAEVLSEKKIGKQIFDLFVDSNINFTFEKKQNNLQKLIRNKEWLRAVKMADKIFQSDHFIFCQQAVDQEKKIKTSFFHRYCHDFIIWWHQSVLASDELLAASQRVLGKLAHAKLQQAKELPFQHKQYILQAIVDRFYFTPAGLQAAIDLGLIAKLNNQNFLVEYYLNKITKHPLYSQMSKAQIDWVSQLNTAHHAVAIFNKPYKMLFAAQQVLNMSKSWDLPIQRQNVIKPVKTGKYGMAYPFPRMDFCNQYMLIHFGDKIQAVNYLNGQVIWQVDWQMAYRKHLAKIGQLKQLHARCYGRFFGTSFNFDNKQTIYAVLNCFNENHNKSEASLVSIDLLTGKINWSTNLQRETIGRYVLDTSQPVSDGNLMYVVVKRSIRVNQHRCVDMKVKTCLEAYDIKTGQLKWSRFMSKQKSMLGFTMSYRNHNEFILPMLPSFGNKKWLLMGA